MKNFLRVFLFASLVANLGAASAPAAGSQKGGLPAAGSTKADSAAAGQKLTADNSQSTEQKTDYLLQPSDLIRIEVLQVPDLKQEVRVSQDYSITLYLIGKVSVRGRTVQQTQETIRALYDKDFIVNPQVNLTMVEYAKHNVNVLGQVNKAGAVPIPPDKPLTLTDAIGLAEGFTRVADRKHVTLTRTGNDGKPITTEINVDDIINSKKDTEVWILREGDLIMVPERTF